MCMHNHRGAVLILMVIIVIVLLMMGALTIDVAMMHNAKAELQYGADHTALATAEVLRATYFDFEADPLAKEYVAAARAAGETLVIGRRLSLVPDTDVAFGQAYYDDSIHDFAFKPTHTKPNAVRISLRMTEDSPNGPLPLFFGGLMNKSTANLTATGTAALTGWRDIAVVVDLSGSMKYDSDLRFYDTVPINARDLWASLDGPAPSRPYIPGAQDETEYASDSGPTIGIMDNWGDPLVPGYDAAADPGLWHMPQGSACTIAAVQTSLANRGYTAGRIATLMGATNNTTEWRGRTAVMLGLAQWTPSGSTDTTVGSSELTWIPYPSHHKNWTWQDYLSWAAEPNSRLTAVHPQFQYRFGLKTYVEFLLDRKDNFSQTDLTATPEEPLRAIKDGVWAMTEMAGTRDRMSLEVFATTSHHEVDLTFDLASVADRLYHMQPNYYNNTTNIGDGLGEGIDELTSVRVRPNVTKAIVLMSDGMSNTGPDPLVIAQRAVDEHIRVYTVSVGYSADRDVMQQIASMTGGQEFFAAGDPAEYTARLQQIYRWIGGLREVSLIK